jgi:hypothetical protein
LGCLAGVVDVDPVERGCEVVRVALPADLAVGDDVEARPFLRADRHDRRVVLGLGEELRSRAPQLLRAHPRREAAGQSGPVDQPFGLGEAADQGRGKQRQVGHRLSVQESVE